MSQWKHELNEIAGDFSEQQARLMTGVLLKKRKKKKRKTIYTTSIVTILVAVLGLFLYQNYQLEQPTTASPPQQQQVEQQTLKFSTPDEPVYYDKAFFMYYKGLIQLGLQNNKGGITAVRNPDAMAFIFLISQQALEYQATMDGFKYDPAEYAKKLEQVKSTVTPELMQEFEEHAKVSGLTIEEYVEQILLPVRTKTALLEQFLGDKVTIGGQQIADFQNMFKEEILALSLELNIKFVLRDE